ncbi:hypothetical protein J31TS4_35180 [Paenibacillus sp. J31TS4]|uniref:DUF3021 family protein n=1 Tax=Paenibacillus sp. J31TS4 TaxID=2807195 RepID=UPI001B067BAE|nr:DUF3021 family protein [Paenibacillus sp. J31TS4]GIP40238.1 hypothetical protein J31TS4_35180 [Paenibacillus sp. J31TS4]
MMKELVKKVFQNFLVIFASIIILLTILRQIFYPDLAFDLKSIYIIMAFSFLSALIGLVLYASLGTSEKNMRVRVAIHFFALEAMLISLAVMFGLVNSISSALLLALEIAVIYTIVRLLSWQNDKKVANQINEGLRALKKDKTE